MAKTGFNLAGDASTQNFFKQLTNSYKLMNKDEEMIIMKENIALKKQILDMFLNNKKSQKFVEQLANNEKLLLSLINDYEDQEEIEENFKLIMNQKNDKISLKVLNNIYSDEIRKFFNVKEQKKIEENFEKLKSNYQQIVGSNTKLVAKIIATKYKNDDFDFFDLLNEGIIGLNVAIDKFDLSKEHKFSTYAVHWVRHYVNRAIQNKSKNIRVPVYIQDLSSKLRKVEKDNQKLSTEELAKKLKVSVSNIKTAQNLQTTVSLNSPLKNTDSMNKVTLESYLMDDLDNSPENVVINNEHSNMILKMLEKIQSISLKMDKKMHISDLEIEVYKARNGIDKYEKVCTYQEISKILNYTKERVRQIDINFNKKIQHPEIRKVFANEYNQ